MEFSKISAALLTRPWRARFMDDDSASTWPQGMALEMPAPAGMPVARWRQQLEFAPSADVWTAIVRDMLAALAPLHAQGRLHGAVCAHAVVAGTDGRWQLLAPQAEGEESVVRPGYSPIEHYAQADAMRWPRGPWSDLYSVAAVAHMVLTGESPQGSPQRRLEDRLPRLSRLAAMWRHLPDDTADLLQTLDECLHLEPSRRPTGVAAFRPQADW